MIPCKENKYIIYTSQFWTVSKTETIWRSIDVWDDNNEAKNIYDLQNNVGILNIKNICNNMCIKHLLALIYFLTISQYYNMDYEIFCTRQPTCLAFVYLHNKYRGASRKGKCWLAIKKFCYKKYPHFLFLLFCYLYQLR